MEKADAERREEVFVTGSNGSNSSNDKIEQTSNADSEQGENKLTFGFVMCMLGFSMAFIVAEVIPLFLVTIFTVIAYDLGAINKAIWILVSPLIATGAIAPFVGSLSDALGRKTITLAALGITVVSMAVMGSAPNVGAFIVGQVLAGVGIGILLLTIIAAASELVPTSKRGAVIGYIVLGFWPFAPASLYGQLIAETSWRWIFLFVGLWTVLSFIVIAIFYNPPPPKISRGLTKKQIFARLDYVGSILSTIGVVLFLVAINWGGQDYPWKSGQVIGCLVGGLVTLIIFGVWEMYGAKHPLFPMELVQHKRYFVAVCLLCLTSGINFVPLTVFWVIQCYAVYGASFRQAGVWLLPLGFCIAGGAAISAILMTVFKRRVHWMLLFFCIMQTIGIACMYLADPNDIKSVWATMIFGLIGVGAVLLPSQVVFSIISPDHLIGTSVALSLVIRMIGQVVGKSMFYNIFQQTVKEKATKMIGPVAVKAGFRTVKDIEALVKVMAAGPLSHYVAAFPQIKSQAALDSIVDAGQKLYAASFPNLYLISIPFGVVAIISCAMLYGIEQYMDDHVAVHLV